MAYILVRHKVADYEKWKAAFDAHSSTRRANGSKGGQLFRTAGDENETVILLEWDDLEKAQQFVQSPDLRGVMQSAGVVDQPTIFFLEEVERVDIEERTSAGATG
jgi:heme-degrading monooxygenase HmoA